MLERFLVLWQYIGTVVSHLDQLYRNLFYPCLIKFLVTLEICFHCVYDSILIYYHQILMFAHRFLSSYIYLCFLSHYFHIYFILTIKLRLLHPQNKKKIDKNSLFQLFVLRQNNNFWVDKGGERFTCEFSEQIKNNHRCWLKNVRHHNTVSSLN